MPVFPRLKTEWLILAAMLALALFGNAFTPVNNDLGWTLRLGRDTALLGHPPTTNLYSFTEPNHPVTMYEWLFCWLSFELHDRWGAAGLIGMKFAFITLTVCGLFATLTRVSRRPVLLLAVGLTATQLLTYGFEPTRAQLVTSAGVAYFTAAALDGRARWILPCVPLMALWANLHGGFIEGVGILVALGGAQLVEQRLRWTERRLPMGAMLAVLALCAAATCSNPYDHRELLEVTQLADSPSRLLAREWLPLTRFSELVPAEVIALVVLAGVLVLALALLRRRQLKLWLLLAMGLVTSLSASRHLRLAPLLLAPVVLAALDDAAERWSLPLARWERWVGALAAAAAVGLGGVFLLRLPRELAGYLDYGGQPNPSGALAVMRMNGIVGDVWNDFDWGGLLLWAVPEARDSCDGRHLIAFSSEMVYASIDFPSGHDPVEVLHHYGADLVLLPSNFPSLARIIPSYPVIFCDDDACLLSHRPEDLAKRDHLRLPTRQPLPSDFFNVARLPPIDSSR